MRRFFIPASNMEGETVTLCGSDARHISRALRMAPGDRIVVCDMGGREYECELVAFSPETVTAKIMASKLSETEPVSEIILYQSLPKSDKMDIIVQKAVELGVSGVVPVESERCVVRLSAEAAERKVVRWRRIAEEAAKQCGRGSVPRIFLPVGFGEAVRLAADSGLAFLCYEGDGTVPLGRFLDRALECGELDADNPVCRAEQPGVITPAAPSGALPCRKISFIVGPEGGFGVGEVEAAAQAGLTPVGLGKRILRCETASGFVLACLTLKTELL